MSKLSRRRFLETSALTAAAVGAGPALAFARPGQRSERIRVGVVGVRGRGRAHIGAFKNSPDAEVAAIVEVDEAVLGPALQAVPGVPVFRDLRELLATDLVDAIAIATPNHWHSLGAVWALQAGKHVYVEKPVSHVFVEGRAVVDWAAKTGLVVQHGTQARSCPATVDAIEWMRAGNLGRVRTARALCYKRRDSIGSTTEPQSPPETMDFDHWTGPAALQPIQRRSVHYDWHWDRNTGNGDIGNQGVHQMDIARWGLGRAGLPSAVQSIGARLGYEDDGNTPNTQVASLEYAGGEDGDQRLIFEVRGLPTIDYRGVTIGNVFHCEGGTVVIASYNHTFAYDLEGRQVAEWKGDRNHVQNFLDAIRAGDPTAVNAPILEGHISSGLGHLANASHWIGEDRPIAETWSTFGADDEANDTWARTREHLSAAGVDPRATAVTVGPRLTFDGASELFTGEHAERANVELNRPDRPPYVFPDPA